MTTMTGTLEKPAYYWSGEVDVIRLAEEYDLHFHIANALKYAVRAGAKGDEAADVRKAIEYVRRWPAWTTRPQMRGAQGLDYMHPIKVANHYGLKGLRKQIVIALLEAAAMSMPEAPRVHDALDMLERWLADLAAAKSEVAA